jgi:hypothetical protein
MNGIRLSVKIKGGRLMTPLWWRATRPLIHVYWDCTFRLADSLPWFLRKHVMNFLLGGESFYNFMGTDYSLRRDLDGVFSFCCVKW